MLNVAATHSLEFEADQIVEELVDAADTRLDGQSPQAALVFACIDIDHQTIVDGLNEAYPGIQLIGATTDGELSSERGFEEDSVTAIFFASEQLEFAAGVSTDLAADTAAATERAVDAAKANLDDDPSLCITTPEGLGINSTTLLEGLQAQLGDTTPIVGGLAGDQVAFQQTYQFANDQVLQDSVPVLLVSGPVTVSHGVASGWAPLGKQVDIRRADGNVIYELGDQTAVEFYRHYIGDGTITDGVFPLAIFEEDSDEFYLRAPVQYDEDQGSITFFGGVSAGADAQITRGERTAIIEATRTSVEQAYENFDDNATPKACLIFSCAGRHQILGMRTSEEYDVIREVIADDVELCGFYTYGEIGPITNGRPSRFHNDTLVTVLVG